MATALQNHRRTRFEDTQRRNRINGSLALKTDYSVRELERAGEDLPAERVRVLPRPKTRTRVRTPLFALSCAAVTAVFAVLMLLNCIELTRLSAETVELKAALTTETQRCTALQSEYERMFDMQSVKEAAEKAGMVKPGASQIAYLNLPREDTAAVYKQKRQGLLRYLAESAYQGAAAVKEYFD